MFDVSKRDLRPYQFPQEIYGLWYVVGLRLGAHHQSQFASFVNGSYRSLEEAFPDGVDVYVRNLAIERGMTTIPRLRDLLLI